MEVPNQKIEVQYASPAIVQIGTSQASATPNMVICSNGQPIVTINLNDGSVTFGKGCTPDEAAKVFWEAVARMHEGKNANGQL